MKHSGRVVRLGVGLAVFALLCGVTAMAQADGSAAVEPAWRVVLGQPIVALFTVIAAGMLLGRLELASISLGSSGVLFVALLFGHLGFSLPAGVGNLGLVLFVYGVGIAAGPSFFRAFVSQGANLAKLGLLLVLIAAGTTWAFATAFDIPTGLAVGIFAGAMTSTPALASAMDALGDQKQAASIGYGLAYPFGVVGVVLFVQLLPRLLKQDIDTLAKAAATSRKNDGRTIVRVLVTVTNPTVIGRKLVDAEFLARSGCQISRVLQGDRLLPLRGDFTFEAEQSVLLVGLERDVRPMIELLGHRSDQPYIMDTEHERMYVVLLNRSMIGRSLRGLDLLRRFGVTVSRITRNDIDFVPNADTLLRPADVLHVVGEPAALQSFAAEAGHRARAMDETDLISLGIGIALGVVLGMVPIGLPGSEQTFSLGLAGGPLFIGLLLGHLGGIGRLRGHIPRASRMLMTELGLVLFLASAGVSAGASFVEVLQQHGLVLFAMGVVVTTLPMLIGYPVARHVLKLPMLNTLGGVCGGMTSTPGLGAITARTDAQDPVVSYATAYPIALIFMSICAQVIVALLA